MTCSSSFRLSNFKKVVLFLVSSSRCAHSCSAVSNATVTGTSYSVEEQKREVSVHQVISHFILLHFRGELFQWRVS